jgi:hypothetical protein
MAERERGATPDADDARSAEPVPFHALGKWERHKRAALTAFTLYHMLAMIVGGSVDSVKNRFVWVFGAYDEGLRMTNSWGMFGKAPVATHVHIEGETADRRWIVLSTTRAQDRTWFERVRDVRIRKIQGKLADEGDRNRLGQPMLAFFCRLSQEKGLGLRMVRIVNEQHRELDDGGRERKAASSATVLRRQCLERNPSPRLVPGVPGSTR